MQARSAAPSRPRSCALSPASIRSSTAPDEADRAMVGELRDRVGHVLALGPPVEWTFTWTRAVVHDTVTRLVSELSPAAVVVGAPRRPRLSVHRSMARWLIGRPNVRAVVVPA